MERPEKFLNTVGVINPKEHYFLPHRLDWDLLEEFIKKNTISFCMRLVKVGKRLQSLNLLTILIKKKQK